MVGGGVLRFHASEERYGSPGLLKAPRFPCALPDLAPPAIAFASTPASSGAPSPQATPSGDPTPTMASGYGESPVACNVRGGIRVWVSGIALLVLLGLYAAFLFGLYEPLALVGLASLVVALPIFITGITLAVLRRRWFSLSFGVLIILATVGTLVAVMSEYPAGHGVASHIVHGGLLFACPFACWLFLFAASGSKRVAHASRRQSVSPSLDVWRQPKEERADSVRGSDGSVIGG